MSGDAGRGTDVETDADATGVLLDAGDGRMVTAMALPARVGTTAVTAEPLRHNQKNSAMLGIWRVRGDLGSAVVKVATPPVPGPVGYWRTSDHPGHWNYWRREACAYTTGLASSCYREAGIAAPELLEAITRPDGLVELWLSDVDGVQGFDWSVERIGRFARELGVGQARWAGRVPDSPWLSRRWLSQYLAEGPPLSVDIRDGHWDDPRVTGWPSPVRRELRRLWADRGRVLAAAEATERTLCHLDVWPANLIDSAGRSVLVDWAFTGEGAVGEDLSNLVIDCFADGLMDPALVPEVAETATDAYLAGLRDGGWSGSSDAVRTATAMCGAAKYSWLGPAVLGRVVHEDLGTSSYNRDASTEEAARRFTGLLTLIADWAALARAELGA